MQQKAPKENSDDDASDRAERRVEEIERLAGQAGLDRNAFISQALRRQVDLTRIAYTSRMSVRELEGIRERLRPYAERAGYTDEEEVLSSTS